MRLNAKRARRATSCGLLLAAALLTASCGGGGQQANDFQPERIIAFGDETSVILDTDGNGNGHKYGVNGISITDGSIDCRNNSIWIQTVAAAFGAYVFPTCNPPGSAVFNPPNRIRATVGARAVDLATQIDAQLAESALQSGDLVTVLVGANDVLAQYAQYPDVSEIVLTQNVVDAGAEVGRQVNRMVDMDAKVLVATIPDVSGSPYALAEKSAHIDTDRQALIGRLTLAFNSTLRATIINDGRRIALALFDEVSGQTIKFPGLNGISNTTTGVCDLSQSMLLPPSILDCTDHTLIPGGVAAAYLWADDRHLSVGGQQLLGTIAAQRARNNPF